MSTCLVPYPRFGDWPGQIVEIMPGHQLRVALFPSLEETIVCQRDVIKDLPAKAPKTWKKGKKAAFMAATKVQAKASKEESEEGDDFQGAPYSAAKVQTSSKKGKAEESEEDDDFQGVSSSEAKVQAKASTSKKRKAEESKDVGSRPKASSSKVTVLEKNFFY